MIRADPSARGDPAAGARPAGIVDGCDVSFGWSCPAWCSPAAEPMAPPATGAATSAPAADQRFPDVVEVQVTRTGAGYDFAVTASSPYDSPRRYADAFRVRSAGGAVLGVRELAHDHAGEQPFTRTLLADAIPPGTESVVVEGRDLVNGWGGAARTVALPGSGPAPGSVGRRDRRRDRRGADDDRPAVLLGQTYARPMVAPAEGVDDLLITPEQAPLLARPYYGDGDPGPIVAALAHVPELLEVALPFLGGALGPSALDLRTKELVIVRTSAVAKCRYCVQSHTVVALDAGLDRAEVQALRDEYPVAEAFADPRERALLAWVDLVAGGGPVPDEDRAAVRRYFAAHEVVELTAVIGVTLMLNRFATALALPTGTVTLDRLAAEGLA